MIHFVVNQAMIHFVSLSTCPNVYSPNARPVRHEASFLDSVSTEWRLYTKQMMISHLNGPHLVMGIPVDNYWSRVSKQRDGLGNPKYSHLMLVVKEALSVSHGQGDVEQ